MLNKSAFFGKRILTIKHVQGDPEITCYSMATTERYVKWPLCHHVCFSDPSNWLCYWSAGVRTDAPSPLRRDRLRGPSSILSSGSKGIAAERMLIHQVQRLTVRGVTPPLQYALIAWYLIGTWAALGAFAYCEQRLIGLWCLSVSPCGVTWLALNVCFMKFGSWRVFSKIHSFHWHVQNATIPCRS